jgi:hypothetical protein
VEPPKALVVFLVPEHRINLGRTRGSQLHPCGASRVPAGLLAVFERT